MRVIIAIGTILFAALGAMGQSLTFEDLLNLQKNDLNKATGYFNYKGWRWSGTEKDCSGCLQQNGYDLAYDKTTWTNNNESVQLLQSAGHPNAVFYYPGQNGYSALEREAKGVLASNGGGTGDDRIWSSYKGNGLLFTFNVKRSKNSYSDQTTYSIAIVNEADVNSRVATLCNSCKGKGQIAEKEKCTYCSGDGRQNCNGCKGHGKHVCTSCNEGKVQCSRCQGKSTVQCNSCYGKGQQNCSKCNGSGKQNQYIGIGTIQVECAQCRGNKTLQCKSCAGAGTLACNGGCAGGQLTCQRCKGNHSTSCNQCNGTGNTDLICNSCNGSGNSSREVKKVCAACNGSKLKTTGKATGTSSPAVPNLPQDGVGEGDIFQFVEQMPEFPGGQNELFNYLSNNIKYPPLAQQNGITGKVFVTFVVEPDGSISGVKFMRGIGGGCDEEAVRVIKGMPKWKPGKNNGRNVRVQFNVPVNFVLNSVGK